MALGTRLTLALLALLACTAAGADTVLHNINGYTSSDEGLVTFNTLVFDDAGRVIATGDTDLLDMHADAIHVDGQQRTVLPGLIDAHAHVAGLGFLKTSLDLTGVPSVDDAVAAIAQYAKDKPHVRWIQGRGWNQVLWPVKEFPTASHICLLYTSDAADESSSV